MGVQGAGTHVDRCEPTSCRLRTWRSNGLFRNAGVAAVGAILFWPALFALDLSDAEKQEIQAYAGRYQVLSGHHKRQSCPGTLPVLVDSDGKPIA